MRYGPLPPKQLPYQDMHVVMIHAERHQRAAAAFGKWAPGAKQAVDMFEGRQWTFDQIKAMVDRPALTFNTISPLVRLVLGYQRNNKSDIKFQPSTDSVSSEEVATILSQLEKSIAIITQQEYVDAEVFMDGIVTGRGWFQTLLDFDNNDLGEAITRACDPFTVMPDPDGDTYNLNQTCGFINKTKMVSIDELEATYGRNAADLLRPYTMGRTPLAPISSVVVGDEVTPVRYWGNRDDRNDDWWDTFYATMGDFVDTARKSIRIIDTEHYVREERNVIIDLETGDKKVLPEHFTQQQLEKILLFCEMNNNPVKLQRRMVSRVQWTTMCGDMLLYNKPSPYQSFSLTGYFPYFRRGFTRGMVEDLIDPQREKNKRRSVEIDMVSKLSNGGWMVHEDALTPENWIRHKRFSSTPGYTMKWKGDTEPKQIQPSASPVAHERLEKNADEDMRKISGINESALGELDRVQSGRAIEARQKQAVIAIQLYMDNFARSKSLLGAKRLELIQNHYTEERIYRVLGEDGKYSQVVINRQQQDPSGGAMRILGDVTLGKYTAVVDQAPMSATFASAQFDEMMQLMEKMGPIIQQQLPMFADLVIDMSTLPRKQEWIQRMQQAAQAAAAQQAIPPGGAPAAGGAPPPV